MAELVDALVSNTSVFTDMSVRFRLEVQMSNKRPSVKWLAQPEEHDYPAAESYLRLICNEKKASSFVKRLRHTSVVEFKSKDIFRASGLSLLGVSNHHVRKNIKKISNGKALSPILLVRDEINGKVVIADGYHRMCAAYEYDEDIMLPCKII